MAAGHDIPLVKKGNSGVLNLVLREISKNPKYPSPKKQSVGTSHGYKIEENNIPIFYDKHLSDKKGTAE